MRIIRTLSLILFVMAGLTACWDDKDQRPVPGEISKAADKALEQIVQGKLPAGKDVFGAETTVFGRHLVPANPAINAPAHSVEYQMSAHTNYATPALTIWRRYDRGAGSHLYLSRGADGRWSITGWGNFETAMVDDVDAKDGDLERRKKYIMQIFSAATACAEKGFC